MAASGNECWHSQRKSGDGPVARRKHKVASSGETEAKADRECGLSARTSSDQNRTWLVGVQRGAADEQCNPAESLIGRHEHSNVPGLPQVESNGQLERIECSKAFRNSILNEPLWKWLS